MVPIVSAICGIGIVATSIFAVGREIYYDVTASAPESVIEINEGELRKIEVNELWLAPGEMREYSFKIECRESADYVISLELDQRLDGGLEEFVEVTVRLGEKKIASGKLKTLLKYSEPITYETNLEEGCEAEFKVTYFMPETVGNEAMGSSTKFDMLLSLNQKGISSIYE